MIFVMKIAWIKTVLRRQRITLKLKEATAHRIIKSSQNLLCKHTVQSIDLTIAISIAKIMIILSTRTSSDSKYWKHSDRHYDSNTSDKDNGHDTVETDIEDDRHKGKLKSLQTCSYCNIFSDRSILIVKLAFASTKALTLTTSAIFKLVSIASISVNTALLKTIPTTEQERCGKKAKLIIAKVIEISMRPAIANIITLSWVTAWAHEVTVTKGQHR